MIRFLIMFALTLPIFALGCRHEMYDQPRGNPLAASDFFPNQSASQPLVAHTVAQEFPYAEDPAQTGRVGTNFVAEFPFPITPQVLERGRERFDIYCAVCHGRTGDGRGMIVTRGFPAPPDYAIPRLRAMPAGYFFDVITRGYGVMYSYASRVEPADRWAIAAYIRALQLSRDARVDDVPPGERAGLESQQP
jgi:mono/diheme cytochrome c family protein